MNPQRKFYVREIEKLTGEPVNAVRRELSYLEKAGLLKSSKEGNLKYFEVDRNFPLYPALRKIIYTTIGIGDFLKEKFENLNSVELAFIYGSNLEDEYLENSDIDLFVVGDIKKEELQTYISKIEKDTGREISYILMKRKKFEWGIKRGDPLIKHILKEKKIILKGRIDG
jgi:predicted nucleotidyltransferase